MSESNFGSTGCRAIPPGIGRNEIRDGGLMQRTPPFATSTETDLQGFISGRGPVGWAAEGIERCRRGDLLGALRSFERSLACDGDCYEAWLGLGEVFMVMKDLRRADQCLAVARRIRRLSVPSASRTAIA
jgi:hypothetical protein